MRACLVLLPLVASACQSNPATPPPAVEPVPGPVEVRGLTLFEEVMRNSSGSQGANLGHVRLVRADPRDPFVRTFTPEAQGETLFEAILQDPARSTSGNLGRVKLIRADPRDPFIRYFDGSR